jgi:hypothetical protein
MLMLHFDHAVAVSPIYWIFSWHRRAEKRTVWPSAFWWCLMYLLETYNIYRGVYRYILKMSGNNLEKFKHMLARWGPQEGCPLENVNQSRGKSFATCWIHIGVFINTSLPGKVYLFFCLCYHWFLYIITCITGNNFTLFAVVFTVWMKIYFVCITQITEPSHL